MPKKHHLILSALPLLLGLTPLVACGAEPVAEIPDLTQTIESPPISPPSGTAQRLFQEPPAKSNFLAYTGNRSGITRREQSPNGMRISKRKNTSKSIIRISNQHKYGN
jgi:hypothetical protein